MATHLLLESSTGYALFKSTMAEEIGQRSQAVQESIADLARFAKLVHLVTFTPFKDAAQALENANDVSEGILLHIHARDSSSALRKAF